MRTQRLGVLGLIAIVAVALGVFLSNRNKGSDASDTQGLVPVLEKRLNDVASVRIEGGTAPFTIKKDGARWVIEEKAGYTADDTKLRQLLIELRRARKLEQKTANATGFAQLGVQEPDAEGSDSRAVVLLDGKGEEITRVIVGKRRSSKGAAQGPVRADEESYVRVSGDEHAWLAAGKLTFETDPLRWLDQALFDVARDRVAAAQFERPEGEALTVSRATKEEFDLKPLTLPEGREAKTPSGTAQALNALAGLRFDDVARAEGFDWPEQADVTTKFWTFDGLKVTAESVDRDGKTWARFRAEVVDQATRPGALEETPTVGPPQPPTTDAVPEVEPAEPEAAEAGDLEPAEAEKPVGPTPEELAAEAQKINDKVGGWVFAVPTWKASAFKLKLDDVLAPLPEPAVEVPNPDELPPGGGGGEGSEAGAPPVPPQEPPPTEPPPTEPPPTEVPPPGGDPGSTDPGAAGTGTTDPGEPDPVKSDPGAPGSGG
jgi:hypothetical protein